MIPEDKLKEFLLSILTTSEDQLDCEEAFHDLDRYAELSLAKGDVEKLLPLVKEHLECCSECHEEYEALLRALQAQLDK